MLNCDINTYVVNQQKCLETELITTRKVWLELFNVICSVAFAKTNLQWSVFTKGRYDSFLSEMHAVNTNCLTSQQQFCKISKDSVD
jgi:hypothetical protein